MDRKIYTRFEEIFSPQHSALVIWDVQNLLVSRIYDKKEFTDCIKKLIQYARNVNVPVIYSKITPLPSNQESPVRIFGQMKRFGIDDPDKFPDFMLPGSTEAQIYGEVEPKENDIVISKNTTSIFIGTNFENIMRNMGIETIIFAGISSEIGISSSTRDSVNRGFYTVVVEDCCSSSEEEMHIAAMKILRKIALVVQSEKIFDAWNLNP